MKQSPATTEGPLPAGIGRARIRRSSKPPRQVRPEVIGVTEGVFLAHSAGAGNVGMVATTHSAVIIHTGDNPRAARIVREDLERASPLPISHIVYTHFHDVRGARIFHTSSTKVIAHKSLPDELDRNCILRAYHQQRLQHRGPIGAKGPNGSSAAPGRGGYVRPDLLVDESYGFDEGGIAFELIHAPAETADHLVVWLPRAKALFPGDLFLRGFPILGGPLTPDRPALVWADSLDRMRALRPEHLLPAHGRPLTGARAIDAVLARYAEAIRFVHDETIRGVNEGLALEEIRALVQLPPALAELPYLQERNGTVAWAVDSIYRHYAGWYTSNPKDLAPNSRAAVSRSVLEACGGSEPLVARARKALENDQNQLVLELVDIVLEATPNHPEALELRLTALGRLADSASIRVLKNLYRTAQRPALSADGQIPAIESTVEKETTPKSELARRMKARSDEASYEDGYFQVGALRLHYLDYGGPGEPLVAIPGLLQNGHSFDGLVPVLSPHVRLLALDMRGRGDSDWAPADCYRWRHYLMDIHAFVKALGLTRFGMIGTSLGATMAMMYAMAHPDQVTRLVMNDNSLSTNRAGVVEHLRRLSTVPVEFASLEEAIAWNKKERDRSSHLHQRAVEQWVSHFLARTPTGKLRLKCDPAIVQQAGVLADEPVEVEWSRRPEVWRQVCRLTMPVLLLRGARSNVVLPESAAQTVQALPQGRCVEVPGVGHAPTLYEPEAHSALCEFFGVPLPDANMPNDQKTESPSL